MGNIAAVGKGLFNGQEATISNSKYIVAFTRSPFVQSACQFTHTQTQNATPNAGLASRVIYRNMPQLSTAFSSYLYHHSKEQRYHYPGQRWRY